MMRIVAAVSLCFFAAVSTAQPPLAVPPSTPLVTLNGHFPFVPPDSVDQWQRRAAELKQRVAVATGLHPMPPRPPVEAVIHSPFDVAGISVQKVYFDSLPGHAVTGLLFRPAAAADETSNQKRPGVLCPHGHGGRNFTHDPDTMQTLLASGDERFADSGQMPKIARCVQLARMGCVVFIFDMVGYGDSQQLPYESTHLKQRIRRSEIVPGRLEPQRLHDTPSVARLQSVMGLQTFNALRALDFLASLKDVDPQRLAVTGGSGGGTQTIMLGALDDRVAVSFPNGMVSTEMQGGCTCENCCYLRIGTGNVELAALMAPRPMAMTAADDWTSAMMTDGYPQLRQLYEMLGAPQNVACEPLLQFKHNYNHATRRVMYGWMNRHLGLGLDEPIEEIDYSRLTDEQLAVWDDEHPAPTNAGERHEAEVMGWWSDQQRRQLSAALGEDADPAKFDQWIRPALEVLYDVKLAEIDPGQIQWVSDRPTGKLEVALEARKATLEGVELLHLQPVKMKDATAPKKIAVWAVDKFNTLNTLPADAKLTLQRDGEVVLVSLGDPLGSQPMNINSKRNSVVYTYGYNRPLAVQRCGHILTAIAVASAMGPERLTLHADDGFAAAALPAAAIAGEVLDDAVLPVNRFRFGDLAHQDDASFVPGMVKYGDVDAWAAARSPHRLTIIGDDQDDFPTARACYADVGLKDPLKFEPHAPVDQPIAVWFNPTETPFVGLEHHRYHSESMNRPVGYSLYMPPGDLAAGERLPVVYWLHGRRGTERGNQTLVDQLDRLIRDGEIPPMILVFASGGQHTVYADSVDGEHLAETTIIQELIPHIDATYPTIANRDGRSIQGMSMGGCGAMKFGLTYPDRFGSVVALAGGYVPAPVLRDVVPMIFYGVFNGNRAAYEAQLPQFLAASQADKVRGRVAIQIICGTADVDLSLSQQVHEALDDNDIEHQFTLHEGIEHNLNRLVDAIDGDNFRFAAKSFVPQP